jgi:CRISPR-associated protein Csm5
MIEKTKLRITTITPVAIGSGSELSPYADYIIENNQICFIDKEKVVERVMAKGDYYLDRYIYGVANGMDNNRSVFDLKSFLTNNKIVNTMDDIVSSKCPFVSKQDAKLPIKEVVKTPLGEPYFPGSSIKGALKTVLMYNRLVTDERAGQTIETALNGGDFDSLGKEFEYNEVENRRNTIQQITDSKILPAGSNIVVDCDRRKIPIRLECISKNQTTEFELTLDNYRWADLAEQANNYAFDCLNRELDILDKLEDSKLNEYYNQILHIQDSINEELAKNTSDIAYLRIGFGKGYYLNSLGIAIYDYVSQKGKEKLYDKFETFINTQFAKGQKRNIKLEDFPKTRLFVTTTKEPLGWVKIERL